MTSLSLTELCCQWSDDSHKLSINLCPAEPRFNIFEDFVDPEQLTSSEVQDTHCFPLCL